MKLKFLKFRERIEFPSSVFQQTISMANERDRGMFDCEFDARSGYVRVFVTTRNLPERHCYYFPPTMIQFFEPVALPEEKPAKKLAPAPDER